MTYLALEIAGYIAAAAAIGALIGWLWLRVYAKSAEQALEKHWRKRYDGERLSLLGTEAELEAASHQLADLTADHKHAMTKAQNMQIAVTDKEQEVGELNFKLREATQKTAEVMAKLREQKDQGRATDAELDKIRKKLSRVETDLAARDERIARLEKDGARNAAQLADAVAARDQAVERVARLENDIATAQTTHERDAGRIAQLEAGLAEKSRAVESANESGQRRNEALERADAKSADLERDIAQATAARDAACDELSRIRAELDAATTAAGTRRRERAEAQAQLDEQAKRMRALQDELAAAQRRAAAVADQAASERAEAGRETDTLRRELKKARHDIESRDAALSQAAETHRAKIERLESIIAKLRRQAATAAKTPANATRPAAQAQAASQSARRDDLKKIRGIGAVLEKKLNALGVSTYRDVVGLSDRTQRERVAAQLGAFAGRIERDDWVAQARKLAKNVKDRRAG